MKDKLFIGIFIVLAVFAALVNIEIFSMVVNADIPDWLKYLLLRQEAKNASFDDFGHYRTINIMVFAVTIFYENRLICL